MINVLESINVQTASPLDSRTVVKTILERDAIPKTVRYLGMQVYVSDEKKRYELKNGTDDSHWEEIKAVAKASELVTDKDHLTVSQTEKDTWNGKAAGDHNHDNAYAQKTHTHQASEITGLPQLPESLKNPHALTIQLNGAGDVVYDGSAVKSVNITAAGIGAQVAGDYAAATHAHTEYLSSQGNVTVNGNLTVTGEILSNNNVTAYSDIRVKKNIRDIDDTVIEKLKKVRFCNFEYKDCKDNRKRVGVIAQELEELFPELVFEDHNGIKTVDYTGLNVYFTFAMQKKLFG